MENVPQKSVEDFPKQIPGGFSKGILGAILEGMQGRFYKKTSFAINIWGNLWKTFRENSKGNKEFFEGINGRIPEKFLIKIFKSIPCKIS